MTRLIATILWMALIGLTMPIGHAQDSPVAFVNAHILPVDGSPIESGVLIIDDGKIIAVGNSDISIPANARRVDLTGQVIIPGLVDTHSHVGNYSRPDVPANADGNEATDPITPHIRALDAIWPADPGIRMALAGGITTANIMPGSGNVISGQTAYVKLRGTSVDEMLIDESIGGMKMANGENPKSNYGSRNQAPQTRMAIAALARQAYADAQHYQAQRQNRKRGKPPTPFDLGQEALNEVLAGDRIVQHHTHRADDILTVLRIANEFDYRVVIQHGTEAWKVADELAAADIPVSLIIIDSPGGKQEAIDYNEYAAKILHDAGVKIAIHTDDFINSSRFLLREGAMAVRFGLDETTALKALTQNGAEMLDLGERVGSLTPGKDADFVVLSGKPFSVYTKVMETWIEGERVFNRADPDDLRYATGGFAVGDRYPTGGAQ